METPFRRADSDTRGEPGPSTTISIVVCTYNRSASLTALLRSLARVEIPRGESCELVIADNGSTDATAHVVATSSIAHMPVRYLFEEHRGKSQAINAALAAARGNIVVCTDDDVRVPVNWLREMTAPIRAGRADAVEGGITLPPHLERAWMNRTLRGWLACTDGLDPSQPQMVGANMAFARHVLDVVPKFDEALGPGALGCHEETLFSKQLLAAGFRLVPVLDAVVEHHLDPARLSRSSFLDSARKKGRSSAYVVHHWEHGVVQHPHGELARWLARLNQWRLTRRRDCGAREGVALWELNAVYHVHFFRQYLAERKRPHAYPPHGLRKMH